MVDSSLPGQFSRSFLRSSFLPCQIIGGRWFNDVTLLRLGSIRFLWDDPASCLQGGGSAWCSLVTGRRLGRSAKWGLQVKTVGAGCLFVRTCVYLYPIHSETRDKEDCLTEPNSRGRATFLSLSTESPQEKRNVLGPSCRVFQYLHMCVCFVRYVGVKDGSLYMQAFMRGRENC